MLAQLVLATPRPLIGIYPTVGHSPGAYDEYQSWLSAAGADSRVLPTTFTGAKLEPLFQSLNGFLIPGGGDPFGESVDAMVRRAVRANEGGDYFPVWGTCLGFEWLTDIFGGSRSTIDDGYDSEGLKLPLTFTAAAAASRTYAAQNASVQHWLATEPLTYNLHHEGIEPRRFAANKGLHESMNVLATGADRKGRAFVAQMEHKTLPIYGNQFHPEKNGAEKGAPSSAHAVAIAQQLSAFLVSEASKSNHSRVAAAAPEAAALQITEDGHSAQYFLSPRDVHSPEVVDGGASLHLKMGERYYLLRNAAKTHSSSDPADFKMFDLVNKTLNVTVDLNGAGCGCNAALYFVSMPSTTGAGKANDWYCDANGVGGMWCSELDFIEANEQSLHTTAHPCSGHDRGSCDHGGYGVKFGNGADDYGPGKQGWSQVDTTKPFVASLTIAGGSGRPRAGAAERFAARGAAARRAEEAPVEAAAEDDSLSASVTLYQNGRAVVSKQLGIHGMDAALNAGMVLTFSYWHGRDVKDMDWLNSPPCPSGVSGAPSCPDHVKFGEIAIG